LKRKLIVLNVVLAVLAAAAGWRLRVEWLAARQHEKEVLGKRIPPAQPPPYFPLDPPRQVAPAQYLDVATKDLFSKDRNSTVVEAPAAAPPPPPPMPKLPVLRGLLDFGELTAIMSEDAKAAPKEVRPGGKVGEFTLVSLSSQEVVLEWNGKEVRKPVQDLMDHTIPEPTTPGGLVAGGLTPPPPGPTQVPQPGRPGVDMGAGRKACLPGDTAPPGTVADGLRKVTWETTFGTGCAWEAPK